MREVTTIELSEDEEFVISILPELLEETHYAWDIDDDLIMGILSSAARSNALSSPFLTVYFGEDCYVSLDAAKDLDCVFRDAVESGGKDVAVIDLGERRWAKLNYTCSVEEWVEL